MRLRLKFILPALAALVFIPATAFSETMTICGPSKGWSYFFNGPMVNSHAGWQQDGLSQGKIILGRNGQEYDIFYEDTVGTKSMRADGFVVMPVPQPTSEFTMLVSIAPSTGIVEHYLFQLDANGNGVVMWGSIKGSGGLVPKSSLYRSECHHP